MLRTRLLTAAILIPIIAWLIYLGNLPFLALMTFLLTVAEVEFCSLAARQGGRPALAFGLGLVWLFLADAQFPRLSLLQPGLALIVLMSLVWQAIHHRRSRVTDWALTIASGFYLGLYGAHLIRLRALPTDGLWWTLTVVPAILCTDGGAYVIGSIWGQHKLAPTLSEGKTWEGYIGGIIAGGLATALLASLWQGAASEGSIISGRHGLILGLLIGTLAPLGDLSISIIKREANVKDSGRLFPGHGGALDRTDSVLWAAVIGYYYVLWFAT